MTAEAVIDGGAGGRRDVRGGRGGRVVGTRAGTVAVSEPPASSPAALAIAANLERGATLLARAVLAAAARAADARPRKPAMAVTEFKVVHGSGVEGLVVPVDGAEARRSRRPPRRARFQEIPVGVEIAGDHLRSDAAVTVLAELRSGDGDITAALVVDIPSRPWHGTGLLDPTSRPRPRGPPAT